MKRTASILLSLLLIFSFASQVVFAEEAEKTVTVSLRIEGYDKTIYNKTVDVKYTTENVTLQDALLMIDEQEAELEFKGVSDNYIYDINGEMAGCFGGWDGWLYAVNDKVAVSGISDIVLKDGDKIVFYYADYPSQYTLIDTEKIKDGVIRFYSVENEYSETGEIVREYEAPITDAAVVFNGTDYVTDESGEINVGKKLSNGEYTVSVHKDKETDNGTLPVIVRITDQKLTVGDKVEPANVTLYAIVTVVVVLLIAVGAFLLIKNKKKKA